MGVGGNGPDKQKESASQNRLQDVFSKGLGVSDQLNTTGQRQQEQGQSALDSATNYWRSILGSGRTQAAQNAAPAVNTAISQSDAQRAQDAQFGSGRSGANVAAEREAGVNAQKNIDDILNENLIGGRQGAAQGLAASGSTDLAAGSSSLSQALQSLGLSSDAQAKILASAQADRAGVRDAQTQIWGDVIKGLL